MSQAFNNNDNCTIIANSFNSTPPGDRSEIQAWLSPSEPRVQHRDIGARRVDSIGAWLLETEEFRRWQNASREDASYHPTFFCDVNLGAGKSYIASLIIDKLCDEAVEGDPTVACFYFDFAARNEQPPVDTLGFLLRQLVSGGGEIPEAIATNFGKEKRSISGRGLQVSGILKIITATKRTFICVDALDECVPEHRMVVLESLGQMFQGSLNIRLFITGRPHVERELGGAASFLFIRATEDGVLRFLREKLKKDTILGIMSSRLEADIMKSIPAISSETFLLAALHIEVILRGTTAARRRKTLKSIKDGAGLGDAYGATLERIKAQDAEASTLRLIHYTVQEYLCCHPGLFIKPHVILAETCLTYLNSQQVKYLTPHFLSPPPSMPFLKYSARYWGTHTTEGFPHDARTLALRPLSQYDGHISAVSLLGRVVHPRYIAGIATSPLFSGLHYASFFGIVTVLINSESCEVDKQDYAGSTPLAWAARNGHEGVVKILLEQENVDPNRPDVYDRTPLGWVASRGQNSGQVITESGKCRSQSFK